MAAVTVVWDDAAVKVWSTQSYQAHAPVDRFAGRLVVAMKARAPVSKVQRVYAARGATVAGGVRRAGDFPLRPSGYLRSSIQAARLPAGAVIIGPTASYARYVIEGTPPHEIRSTGPWPLRNRATGQVFGRVVHHPGTAADNFIAAAVADVAGAHAVMRAT